FSAALPPGGTLSRRLAELIRLRIAFHNRCRSCMAIRYGEALDDGVTDDLVCSLEKPYDAPDLTDAERAALRFADLFAEGPRRCARPTAGPRRQRWPTKKVWRVRREGLE